MDAQVPRFGIRITERSSSENIGSFVLVARFPGSPNPTPRRIDDYPAMSLAKARQLAREWKEDLARGIDPKEKAATQKLELERQRADTFAAIFERYAEAHLANLRTGKAVAAAVRSHVFPALGARPVGEIKRREVATLISALRTGRPVGAIRVFAYLKTFFAWAVDQDLIETSPMASSKRPSGENERDRVLAEWEIRAIWRACAHLGAFGRAFRLMLVTGQRRSEVGGMTWQEIDRRERIWTLSKARTKAARAHDVPLSELALSIIDSGPELGDFVFSTGRSGVGRAGTLVAPSGWGKAKSKLDELAQSCADEIALQDGEKQETIAEWRLHDLRRTCATHLGRLGVDRLIIGKVLNHAEQGVTRRYDRHEYSTEKRAALDRWASQLEAIINGQTQTNVVRLPLARPTP